ncbi:Copper resistance protein B [Pseudodesulfovibrio profundus]|uniref:Copper resistance protein B n=1 Tax=Pseudodesulfovibrio profundus TaxID=57320 RepID=A0A2C8FE68_9BACT|nr:copper resistance protein B [Pseudodesulfovibrio profundus]SOB60466.1 Copper resistance protein B [Pseudodesulfovibrio profundus]
MNRYIILILAFLSLPMVSFAEEMEDDPLLFSLMVDKLEMRTADDSNPVEWDASFWVGKDINKLMFKTEGEYHDQKLEEVEYQALYNRAISAFWDLHVGGRKDTYQEPGKPDRNWFAIGFEGVAPYNIEIDTALFLGEEGRSSLRFKAEYEILFTQRLVLVPEVEMDFYGTDDSETQTGSGLSETELGMRLKYEIKREFAPYIGVNWSRLWGQTADYAKDEGEDFDNIRFVTGVSFWF